MLCFSNPGEIDPRLITTLGVNVKEGQSPIGFFGTGLKYAIANAVRLGWQLEIQAGSRCFRFEPVQEEIRGKSFTMIDMVEMDGDSIRLGFTADLGKTWEPWMVYRELRSNSMDEGGMVEACGGLSDPIPGQTRIFCSNLDEIHAESHKYFFSGRFVASDDMQVKLEPATSLFYRGIRVGKLENVPSLFTWNCLSDLDLTEDRTLTGEYVYKMAVQQYILRHADLPMLERILIPDKHPSWEQQFNWSEMNWYTPSDLFLDTVERLAATRRGNVAPTALSRLASARPKKSEPERLVPTKVQKQMLSRAAAFLAPLGYVADQYPIALVKSLGTSHLGQAQNGVIFLASLAFEQGTKRLAGTLMEEFWHLERGFKDETYEFQNFLIDKIMSLQEESNGEAL